LEVEARLPGITEYFISCYEKAMAEVQNKKPKVIHITSQEVRRAAERMRNELTVMGRDREPAQNTLSAQDQDRTE
jgi:hypothetical protein